jgi:peptide/nickel transport system permease protein
VTAFVVRRLLQSVLVLFLVSIIVFMFAHAAPGDPVQNILGINSDPTTASNLREQLGLNKPLPEQYALWVSKAVRGDLGKSLFTREPVNAILKRRVAATLQIALGSFILSLIIGLSAGTIAALYRNRWPDYLSSVVAVSGVAMPSFWFAIMLIVLLSETWRLLPTSGYVSFISDPIQSIKLSIMPWIVAGFAGSAVLMRQMRSALLEVLNQDYVRTARAKGLLERVVIMRHAMKNALIPIVTIAGMMVGFLLAGQVVIEVVFSIPGVGAGMVKAIMLKDFPIVQGTALMVAVCILAANLLVDIAYGWLDPRIRVSS